MDSFVQGWMTFQPSPLSTWIILSAALTKNYNQIQFNVAVETHNKSNHSVDNLWFSFFFIVFFFFFSIRFGNGSRCGIFMRQQFFDSGNGSGEECSSLIPNSFLRLLLFRLLLLLLSLSLYFPIYLFISISIPWIFLSIQISFLYSFIYFSFPFPFSFFFVGFADGPVSAGCIASNVKKGICILVSAPRIGYGVASMMTLTENRAGWRWHSWWPCTGTRFNLQLNGRVTNESGRMLCKHQ